MCLILLLFCLSISFIFLHKRYSNKLIFGVGLLIEIVFIMSLIAIPIANFDNYNFIIEYKSIKEDLEKEELNKLDSYRSLLIINKTVEYNAKLKVAKNNCLNPWISIYYPVEEINKLKFIRGDE